MLSLEICILLCSDSFMCLNLQYMRAVLQINSSALLQICLFILCIDVNFEFSLSAHVYCLNFTIFFGVFDAF